MKKKRFILNYTTPVASLHRKQQFQKTFILMIGKIVNKIYLFTFPRKQQIPTIAKNLYSLRPNKKLYSNVKIFLLVVSVI